MKKNTLGRKTKYKFTYDPKLLFAIPREKARKANCIKTIFTGYDIWNCYELSWLSENGKPENRIIRIVYSALSKNIVESKSLKLYLNSFSMTKFNNEEEIKKIILKDLTALLKPQFIHLEFLNYKAKIIYKKIPEKILLDKPDIKISKYQTDKTLLKISNNKSNKTIEAFSNLLKTNCPVTGQPDWASVYIKYKADNLIEQASLLEYIVSFRMHSDFHEASCEYIFNDLFKALSPEFLIVKCFFTRRGGIEINPCRFYNIKPDNEFDMHYFRQ